MIEFLLPALGSVIGAGINRKSAQETNALQDPVYVRERLEAAGLNPDAHYGSAASRSFVTPQMGSIIAQGLAATADVISTEKQLKIQRDKLKADNERLNRQVERHTLNPTVKGIYNENRVNRTATNDADGVSVPVPDLSYDGISLPVDQETSSAELFEERYGDPLSWLVGIGVAGADLKYNLPRLTAKKGEIYLNPRPRKFRQRPKARPKYSISAPRYNPALNPPLRGYYGPPGSRTGF